MASHQLNFTIHVQELLPSFPGVYILAVVLEGGRILNVVVSNEWSF